MQFEEWTYKRLKPKYLSLIERLVEVEIADECTIPFVPYVGGSYSNAKPKILIIGKATFGWGKGDEGQGSGALNDVLGMDDHALWEHLVELPKEFIEGEIIPFYGGEDGHYNGPFWRRIYQLSSKLLVGHPVADYKRERHRSEECFRSIAWSNVFKVGALKSEGGNPKKKLIDIQKEENKKEGNAFEEEITALQPDVVIFSTGPDEYDKADEKEVGELLLQRQTHLQHRPSRRDCLIQERSHRPRVTALEDPQPRQSLQGSPEGSLGRGRIDRGGHQG